MPRKTKKKRRRPGRPRIYNDILHEYWREQKRRQRMLRKELERAERVLHKWMREGERRR